ncbi:LuxR C-terminal-related transcriptional regulator [Sphingopyxis italica]
MTEKQRACLDLLLERKTSKQIARDLDISKQAVDLRLTTARDTLGAANRDETAIIYARLRQTYDRIPCDPIILPAVPELVPSNFPDGSPPNLMDLHDSVAAVGSSTATGSPFRDLFRHDFGSATRIGIMLAVVVILLLVPLGGLGIAHLLTELVSR